jgi:hypothetical protein
VIKRAAKFSDRRAKGDCMVVVTDFSVVIRGIGNFLKFKLRSKMDCSYFKTFTKDIVAVSLAPLFFVAFIVIQTTIINYL